MTNEMKKLDRKIDEMETLTSKLDVIAHRFTVLLGRDPNHKAVKALRLAIEMFEDESTDLACELADLEDAAADAAKAARLVDDVEGMLKGKTFEVLPSGAKFYREG